jgi:hypothetical protein
MPQDKSSPFAADKAFYDKTPPAQSLFGAIGDATARSRARYAARDAKTAKSMGINPNDPTPAEKMVKAVGSIGAGSRQVYANRNAGLPSNTKPSPKPAAPAAPERKVNMRTGMGNTDAKKAFAEKPTVTQGLLNSNPLAYIKANPGKMNDALGYGTDMLSRDKAAGTRKEKSEYINLLRGSDVFRKLDSESQKHTIQAYSDWLQSQSVFKS